MLFVIRKYEIRFSDDIDKHFVYLILEFDKNDMAIMIKNIPKYSIYQNMDDMFCDR